MSVKQLSVFAENKNGSLYGITDILQKNDIDIRAFSVADTPGYVISKNPTDFGLSERGATSLYRISAYTFLYLIGKQHNQQAIKALTPQA